MALIPQIDILEPIDNSYLDVNDITGTYDAALNAGGFGAPNPASTDVASVVINIYFPGSSVPYILTLTISTGAITNATITDIKGVATDITSELVSLVFPFTEALPLRLLSSFFGFGTDAEMPDGVYTFETTYSGTYSATPFSDNNSEDFAIVGIINNTLDSKLAAIDADDFQEGCECIDQMMKVDFLLDTIYSAMDVGMTDQAQNTIDYINQIIETGCNGCD